MPTIARHLAENVTIKAVQDLHPQLTVQAVRAWMQADGCTAADRGRDPAPLSIDGTVSGL